MSNWLKKCCLKYVLGDSYNYFVRIIKHDSRLPTARMVDIVVRKDAVENRFEADWLKILARLYK